MNYLEQFKVFNEYLFGLTVRFEVNVMINQLTNNSVDIKDSKFDRITIPKEIYDKKSKLYYRYYDPFPYQETESFDKVIFNFLYIFKLYL